MTDSKQPKPWMMAGRRVNGKKKGNLNNQNMCNEVHKRQFSQGLSRPSRTVILNQGWFCPPKGFGIVCRHFCFTQFGGGCYLYLVERIQRCCHTPHNAQDSPHLQQRITQPKMSRVSRLRNPALERHFLNSIPPACHRVMTFAGQGAWKEMWFGKGGSMSP